MSCGISSSFPEVFPTSGQVTHVLLTRPPLDWRELPPSASFDLHVLSTPPAFILSQDQTLHLRVFHRRPPKRTTLDSSQTLLLRKQEKLWFFRKPGKRRLARSTQFSRNRILGGTHQPADDAVLPAPTLRKSRPKAELSVSQNPASPSTTTVTALRQVTGHGSRDKEEFRKNRKPLQGREI
jgi:hypothetical protein